MKFTLLWEATEGARKTFEDFRRNGFVYGIKMIRLDNVNIIDKVTGAHAKPAFAVRCQGPLLGYLKYKREYKGYQQIGWKP